MLATVDDLPQQQKNSLTPWLQIYEKDVMAMSN